MPSLRWTIRATLTRLNQRNAKMWNTARARSAKAKSIPVAFAHYPEPRSIGSFDTGQNLKDGQFFFAGNLVQAPAASIWSITPPTERFMLEVQGFGWLDDLAAVGDKKARMLAQEWALDWIDHFGNGTNWTPALAGQRILRICANAKFLFQGLDEDQAKYLFKSIAKQLTYLEKNWRKEHRGQPRIKALTGLIFAGVSFMDRDKSTATANKGIGAECAYTIGEAGEIPSRNPEELMEIFTLLTWAARTLEDAEITPDPRLTSAMEQIAPTLRNLRLGDGTLTRFHGGGRGREGRLDQVLSDSRIRGNRAGQLSMGYDRLTSSRITLLVDCASAPKHAASEHGHASTLAFEMSSGRIPIIINCGAGQKFGPEWERVCRETGAHNAVAVNGISSSKIADSGFVSDTFGKRLLQTPTTVTRTRNSDLQGNWLLASHDGYAREFGLIHQRRLFLSPDGTEFRGQDNLAEKSNEKTQIVARHTTKDVSFNAHFHLHPDVGVQIADNKKSVALKLSNGEVWMFQQNGGTLALEESVYLDQWHLNPRATKQIVVTGEIVEYVGQITWIFKRIKDGERFASPERITRPE